MLRLLCERADVDVNKLERYGWSALYCVSQNGHVGCMRILLDVGKANVGALSRGSCTALHVSAFQARPHLIVHVNMNGQK